MRLLNRRFLKKHLDKYHPDAFFDFLRAIIDLLHKLYLQNSQNLYTVITGSYRDSEKKKKTRVEKVKYEGKD